MTDVLSAASDAGRSEKRPPRGGKALKQQNRRCNPAALPCPRYVPFSLQTKRQSTTFLGVKEMTPAVRLTMKLKLVRSNGPPRSVTKT
jgi:hypothetical protein